MIRVTFRYKDSSIVDMLAFPQRPVGLKQDGKRPYRAELKGTYTDESVEKLKIWIYGDIYRALAPKRREITCQVEDMPVIVEDKLT